MSNGDPRKTKNPRNCFLATSLEGGVVRGRATNQRRIYYRNQRDYISELYNPEGGETSTLAPDSGTFSANVLSAESVFGLSTSSRQRQKPVHNFGRTDFSGAGFFHFGEQIGPSQN